MSNPNWGKKGSKTSINKQLEEFGLEDCLTREQYMRGRETKETPVEKVTTRRDKRK